MKITRSQAQTPCITALAHKMTTLNGPCIGCDGCQGICAELIETLTVPEVILTKGSHGK